MANIIGLITVNSKEILEVDAAPGAGGGTAAPIASLAMFDDSSVGRLYIKSGAADTAWTLVDTNAADWSLGGNTLGADTNFGSVDDFSPVFIRNNIEVMRMFGATAAANGLLIGLNASLGGRLQLAPDAEGDDILKEVLSPGSNPVIKVSRMFRMTTSGAATDTMSVLIPEDYNAKLQVDVVARQTAGSSGAAGDGASYQRTCHARNLADTVTMFKQQTDYTYEVVNGLDFALSASGANIVGTVQGVANRDISWGAHAQLLLITT